jgi:hypothetical protein
MPMDKILSLVMQAAVAMVSLLAIYLTTSLAMRSQLRLRRVDLIKQKLEEFYTPMLALLTQNGALFRSFGPHTFPNALHRREAAAQVWNELRSKIILPNNELMLKILAEKSHLISQLDSYDNYVPLQNHIIMYKIFCENPNGNCSPPSPEPRFG